MFNKTNFYIILIKIYFKVILLYKTLKQSFFAEQEIKKSLFLAYLCPYENFLTLKEELKNEHKKAVHIVWAYRYLNDFQQIVENQSDDGEPKGTSGLPALNALKGAKLINSATLIVRYFGGIKLGTGGLVRAYSSSVNLAIQAAKLEDFILKESLKFFINYPNLAKFEYFFSKNSLEISEKNFNEKGCFLTCKLSLEEKKLFQDFSKDFLEKDFFIERENV